MTRRALVFVVLCLLLTGSLVTADDAPRAPLAASWRDQAQAAYGEKDWAEAIFLYRKWLEADPRDDASWYNLACCYALAGQKDAALTALARAADAGWNDDAWPKEDPDLASLRSEQGFQGFLERAAAQEDADAPKGYVRHWIPIPAIGTYVAMLPPDYEEGNASYPLVVILHGNGSTETGHGKLADALGREGVIYIAPRAPYPNEGVFLGARKPGWTWAPEGFGRGVDSPLHPQQRYVTSILASVDDATKRYRVRGDRIYVLGHSMGAFFANTLAMMHPGRVASYFAYAGGISEGQQAPEGLARLAANGVRVFLAHGLADRVVAPAFTEEATRLLEAADVDVTTVYFDGQDHGIGEGVRAGMKAWIDDVVRPERPDGD